MNTMNRTLLCTPLLLLAALCSRPVFADAQYNPSVNLPSPTPNFSYDILLHSDGRYYAVIPISVTNQYVEIKGATASTTLYIQWSMTNRIQGPNANGPLSYDNSAGPTLVGTDGSGNFRCYFLNASPGSWSMNFRAMNSGSWTVSAGSSITDPTGLAHSLTLTVKGDVYWIS